ncbi:hypothetical protein [Spirillospora sp. CA-294931]
MAAVPDGDATRFAYMAGFRLPGTRALGPVLRAVLGPVILRRFVRRFAR